MRWVLVLAICLKAIACDNLSHFRNRESSLQRSPTKSIKGAIMRTHKKPSRSRNLALACSGIGLVLMTAGAFAANAITLQSCVGGINAIAVSGDSLVKTGASVNPKS